MGRRVSKKVYSGSESAWTLEKQTTFTYDGWNLIQEQTASGSDVSLTNSAFTQFRTSNYTWGLDLSQTIQGAGGVSGLLSLDKGTATYYYTYDANGNVSELIDTAGNIAAHYEYSPFGKVVYKSGLMKDENPFQFSTKYLDNETQLYYYGLRYYNPENGRWINRDPIEEDGGFNTYGFVSNRVTHSTDFLGRQEQDHRGPTVGDGSEDFDPYINPMTGGAYSNNSEPPSLNYGKDKALDDLANSVLGYFAILGMGHDWAGEEILKHYLKASGEDFNKVGGKWGSYMMAYNSHTSHMRAQIKELQREYARHICQNQAFNSGVVLTIFKHFHTQIGGDKKYKWYGYTLLYGSNANVGDFEIEGTITVLDSGLAHQSDDCKCHLEFDWHYTFNDIQDPNPKYDSLNATIGDIASFGNATPFKTRIEWDATAEFLEDWSPKWEGWPWGN